MFHVCVIFTISIIFFYNRLFSRIYLQLYYTDMSIYQCRSVHREELIKYLQRFPSDTLGIEHFLFCSVLCYGYSYKYNYLEPHHLYKCTLKNTGHKSQSFLILIKTELQSPRVPDQIRSDQIRSNQIVEIQINNFTLKKTSTSGKNTSRK